jgi:outer membrane protein OmpA-like peptidoglycan-associated protein
VSFGYVPVTSDRDGDGILDRDDACPDVPEDKDDFEDLDGCPEVDNDKDAILDVSDGAVEPNGFGSCRNVPEDKDGYEDRDGCPDPDNDKDFVADADDGPQDATGYGKCRDMPEDKDAFEDHDGCPDGDNDQDGFLDLVDGAVDASGFGACRNDAEDKDGHEDSDGCPEPDNDGDGVLDVGDGPRDPTGYGSCRDAPETRNDYADEDGCPDTAPKKVRVTQFRIEILDKVFFEYNKATIQAVSFPLLDEVALVIQQHPQLTRIRVEGHTDFHGDDAYNEKLSQERADAVMQHLVQHGVAAGRLEAKGWGEQRPLVEGPAGKTNDGRARNRRVEFHIIEVNGQPHSPEKPVIIEKHEVVP